MPMPRPPRPDDLTRFRIPTDPRLSPDGTQIAFVVKTSAPRQDGYRHAIWLVPADGSRPARQVTLGAKNDRVPRFSPDGQTLAFLSDRRTAVEDDPKAPKDPKDREDVVQVHLLPLDGGEARRLTDLPRGVDGAEWSPDGHRFVVSTASHGATREEDERRRGKADKRPPGSPPESDYRFVDRLGYLFNGQGFVYDQVAHLWIVDAETGEARRLTDGPTPEEEPVWSPDGTGIAFVANRRRDHDLRFRRDIFVVDVDTRKTTAITAGGESVFGSLVWLPDGKTIAALGGRLPANTYRFDIWLFAADGSDARADGGRNISDPHDLMPGSGMNSDLTIGEPARLIPSPDGRSILFLAPINGSYELWRIAVADGRTECLTDGQHYISSFDVVPAGRHGDVRAAFIRSAPTELPEVHVAEIAAATRRDRTPRSLALRRVTELNSEVAAEVELRAALDRRWTVDGREIQGWLIPAGNRRQPLVTEIHGGPHSLYGWSPVWEFQILAANGMSVFYPNPRGSEGYGRAFNEANLGDWGPGPMKDVLAGIDALVADGLADPNRLGLTGGSYGGYLTNWILAFDQRFAAGFTARSVSDMLMLFLTGDISGGEWGEQEFGRVPWLHPDYYREISPLTYAHQIRTPLLIQHSEKDLRTTVGQAEALFTVLRSHRRPVRLMRVPDETHELTRSGTPFRRVENLVQVRDWFRHFLVEGKTSLPPLPKARAGK
jgi:dipeptidyl aminopeptidase/acylaminoacyl peptidase